MEDGEWAAPLQRIDILKEQRSILDAEISSIEQSIKDAYALTSLQGDWVNTGTRRFKVTQQKGRRTLNKDKRIPSRGNGFVRKPRCILYKAFCVRNANIKEDCEGTTLL